MEKQKSTGIYIASGISLPIRASEDEVFGQAGKSLLKFFSKDEILSLHIARRSVDARKKTDIRFVYSVSADVCSDRFPPDENLAASGITREKQVPLSVRCGTEKLDGRPVVVGFGPCGMFCAYLLAQYGYKPIVIERGSDTAKRSADVLGFRQNQILNPESNIQFGAGGAGTFSDGKLMTRIGDPLCKTVVDTFLRFGAPENIAYEAKPHIGTDYLCKIVDNMKRELLRLGADIYFDTRLDSVCVSGGKVKKIVTSKGEMECGALVLALGHSARDTVKMLLTSGFELTAKPFSVGVRIEHLQSMTDVAMYGAQAGNPILPHADYALSSHTGGRGVYTFCMCPGGEVAAAASEPYTVVTNGMSRHVRDGENSNSAVCVSVLPEDFGGTVTGAERFVESIEQKAFILGGSSYFAPAQTVGSFLGSGENKISSVLPTYMDGKVKMTDISGLFPKFISDAIGYGIKDFDRKLRGFASPCAVLTAPETRTSSPVRMNRTAAYLSEGFDNVYPCGEGAGYAGGITSAAVDGLRCAMAMTERYAKIQGV